MLQIATFQLRSNCVQTLRRSNYVIQDLVSDLLSKQGEVNEMIDGGNKFIDDNSLPEDDRKTIHDKMVILHDDWNKLATLTSGKQQRLVSGNHFTMAHFFLER